MSKTFRYIFILSLCLLMTEVDLFGQSRNKRRPTSTSAYRGRYKNIKVSRAKAKVVCPIFEDSQYPYQGIGIKVGDPFAITYKFYAAKNFAIAIDGGKAASGLYSGYHRENFQDLIEPDTLGFDQGVGYLGHIVKKEWVLEGKALYQRDASKVLKGLQWYVGAGWQWRNTDIQYEYLLEISFDENEINILDESYLTMGPVAVLGIEYSYFTIPVSAFMEIEWYTDVVQDPGWQRFQGGVGLRLIF
ncbi:hypothetical protein [Fulvivirga lutimaris]|uniref:hypothetical protein n=1 Tax=Fulvivirga lutimaris TaxID=1819566 RepID=UPI0012BD0C80|nr:hypothetical protein [Fulvivirga lutimaris]MTI41610.1 hypothetical protein [Fulvivirga lutimaris]